MPRGVQGGAREAGGAGRTCALEGRLALAEAPAGLPKGRYWRTLVVEQAGQEFRLHMGDCCALNNGSGPPFIARVRAILQNQVKGPGERNPQLLVDWFYRPEDMQGMGWKGEPLSGAAGMAGWGRARVPEIFLSEHNDWVDSAGVVEPVRVMCLAADSPEHRSCVESFKASRTSTYCCFCYFNVEELKTLPLEQYVTKGGGDDEAVERCKSLMERASDDHRDGFPELGFHAPPPASPEKPTVGTKRGRAGEAGGPSIAEAEQSARPGRAPVKEKPPKAPSLAAELTRLLKSLGPEASEGQFEGLSQLADNFVRQGDAGPACVALPLQQRLVVSKCIADDLPELLRSKGEVSQGPPGVGTPGVLLRVAEGGVLKILCLWLKDFGDSRSEIGEKETPVLEACLAATARLPIPSKEFYQWMKAVGLGRTVRNFSINISLAKSVKAQAKSLMRHWAEYIDKHEGTWY